MNLRKIWFPDGLREIGLFAFSGSGIDSFVAPRSLRTIRQGAFYNCRNLKYVQLNEGLEVLGTDEYPSDRGLYCGVFEGSALESVTLPSTLRRIGYRAFIGCEKLEAVSLPDGLEKIG